MSTKDHADRIIALYDFGLSPQDIAGEIDGLTRGAVKEFLARRGLLRTQSEAASLAAALGKKAKAVAALVEAAKTTARYHPDKVFRGKRFVCELCDEPQTNGTARQKWCSLCVPDKVWRHRASRYGVGVRQWERMLEEQGGTCALCSAEPVAVDHDHDTGEVRGLLCGSCNLKLSGLDNRDWLKKARQYARR